MPARRRRTLASRAELPGQKAMNNDPLVSIVIVSYNAPEYLRRCLESIRRRTATPHELIVIDNASREETRAYLRSLDFIRLTLNPDNRLWCAGCNQGIRQSS